MTRVVNFPNITYRCDVCTAKIEPGYFVHWDMVEEKHLCVECALRVIDKLKYLNNTPKADHKEMDNRS